MKMGDGIIASIGSLDEVFRTCIANKEGVVATTKWVWAVTDVCELCHSSATVLIVRRALSRGAC